MHNNNISINWVLVLLATELKHLGAYITA